MFDVEKFIYLVEQNQPLWKKTAPGYADRDVKSMCWEEIAEEMFIEKWAEMNDLEKNDQIKIMKGKWRHIRDSFVKVNNHNNLVNRGHSNARTKKYVYADSLSFLLNSIERKGKTTRKVNELVRSDDDNDNDNDDDDGDEGNKIYLVTRADGGESTSNISSQNLTNNTTVRTIRKSPKYIKRLRVNNSSYTPFQKLLMEKLDNLNSVENDADKLFLLSLMPDVKKLNDKEKLNFRLHCLNFFYNQDNKDTEY